MNFPFYIARRYLFSKKSHHAINIISAISVCGVALATMALVCTMSVFNGFQDLVASFFTAIDPQLKVTPSQGKTMAADDPKLTALKAYPGIKIYTETLEDHALVICGEHQAMVTIKGVDDNFAQMADLNKLLYGDGTFTLHADVLEFGVLGIQLAAQLGLGASFDTPLRVYAPQKGEQGEPVQSYRKLHTKRIILTRCGFCRETGQIRCRLHPYLPTFCPGFVRATGTCFRHRIATARWCGHPSGTSRYPKNIR